MCWTQEIKSHCCQKIREGKTRSVNPPAYTYKVDPHGKDQIYPKKWWTIGVDLSI